MPEEKEAAPATSSENVEKAGHDSRNDAEPAALDVPKGAKTDPELTAEESYFASMEKDDTLVKKPKTLPIEEPPDVRRAVRWGSVFLGKSAKLAIHIKTRSEPVHIEVQDRFVIGRVHPRSEEKPDLDLNKYGGFFHGVSRQHAAILKDENLLQVEDLGSTNGTYLNGTRLLPHQPRMLRDGDELCLGHLILRVYYLNLESDALI
jgi:hypothetical protein